MSDNTNNSDDSNVSNEAKVVSQSAVETQEQAQQQKEQQKNNESAFDEKKKMEEIQAKLDKINQELSELPNKIEDKVTEINQILDKLLGKSFSGPTDPSSPQFDINVLIGQLKASLNPLLSVTAPLAPAVGAIPVIGDLGAMLPQMAAASKPASGMTKEEILEKVPTPPEIPPDLLQKIDDIKGNIDTVCQTLPTMEIDLAFQMLDVVYSKLNIITSVIPLGGMFPLSLVPSAVTAQPAIKQFIKTAPSQVKNMVKGMVKEKLAEAMALSTPTTPTMDDALQSQTDDIKNTYGEDGVGATPPEPETPPTEPPVVAEPPPVIPAPSPAPIPLTWDDMYSKWCNRFNVSGYKIESDKIKGIIDDMKQLSECGQFYACELMGKDGTEEDNDSAIRLESNQVKRIKYTPDDCDDDLGKEYMDFKSCHSICYDRVVSKDTIMSFSNLTQPSKNIIKDLPDDSIFRIGLYVKKGVNPKRKKKTDDDDDD